MVFWSVVLGGLVVVAAVAGMMAALWRPMGRAMLNGLMDPFITRIVADQYTENLFGVVNVMRHVGPQNFVETMMRASQGTAISRPMGSPLQLSPWDQLLFQPVYLTPRLPTPEKVQIDSRVTIGPKAEKPLQLDIPILITGMSYGGALSVEAKVALAKGANLAGTATNSGESYLPEERAAAQRLILQHNRGLWPKSTMNQPELLKKADAIEIQLGQGAQAAAAMWTATRSINEKMRDVFGLEPGEIEMVGTRFRGVDTPKEFVRLVKELKAAHPVPVGVKVGVSDYIEREIEIFLEAGVDFITIDGAEGGTHGGPPTLQDDVGLPTLHGISRADQHLRSLGVREGVTLLASGQLSTPGRFLKAMALGADAVYIGTVAIIALLSEQMHKTLPGEPPYDLVMHSASARWNRSLDVDRGAEHLANYLKSAMVDISYVVQSLGKVSVAEVDRQDLVALSRDVAEITGVRLAWHAAERTEREVVFTPAEQLSVPPREERVQH